MQRYQPKLIIIFHSTNALTFQDCEFAQFGSVLCLRKPVKINSHRREYETGQMKQPCEVVDLIGYVLSSLPKSLVVIQGRNRKLSITSRRLEALCYQHTE